MTDAQEDSPGGLTPDWDELRPGERLVILALREMSDDTGKCVASAEHLIRFTGFSASTVRVHIGSLLKRRRIKRRRCRSAAGTWDTFTYWLDFNALNLVDIDTFEPSMTSSSTLPAPKIEFGQKTQGGENERHPKNPAVAASSTEEESARVLAPPPARAPVSCFSLPSSFLPRDEEHRWYCEQVISVCGPGLADPATSPRVMASLVRTIDRWLEDFDFEAEVLPIVRRQTSWVRKSGPLYDFGLLTVDIRQYHQQLSGEQAQRRQRSTDTGRQSEKAKRSRSRSRSSTGSRIRFLEDILGAIERGEQPTFALPGSERNLPRDELSAAFSRLSARFQNELSGLRRGAK